MELSKFFLEFDGKKQWYKYDFHENENSHNVKPGVNGIPGMNLYGKYTYLNIFTN